MTMVTVIIPTYGSPQFLKASIESVIAQTYSDWELIVVDDNNPDTEARKATQLLVAEFIKADSRIRYIPHSHNKNGAAARNTAFVEAKGDYISFLDSDDEYLSDRLAKCVAALEAAEDNVAGVYTGCEFRRGGKTYLRYTDVKTGTFLVDTLACRFMFCTGSNIFMRRSVVDELHGFDETFLRHQDYEFLVRVFEKYSLKAIPEILVIKNNENFNLPNIDKMEAVKRQYLHKFASIIHTLPDRDRKYVYYANYISLAEQCLRQQKRERAKEFYHIASDNMSVSFRDRLRKYALILKSYAKK